MATSSRGNHETTDVAHTRSRGEETKPSFKTTEPFRVTWRLLSVADKTRRKSETRQMIVAT